MNTFQRIKLEDILVHDNCVSLDKNTFVHRFNMRNGDIYIFKNLLILRDEVVIEQDEQCIHWQEYYKQLNVNEQILATQETKWVNEQQDIYLREIGEI